ncbi:SRPBCC family protein [Kaarinaea lacus]
MRTIRLITILLATLGIAAVIVALALGGKWQLQVSKQINAPAHEIFPYINTLKKWPDWTVWNKTNHPNMQMTYEGAESGAGAIQIWHEGKNKGILEITASETNQYIQYRLNMGQGLFLIQGQISLSESPQGTEVTWKLWGDNSTNLIARLMALAFKPMLKKDLAKGLSNLQQLNKQQP